MKSMLLYHGSNVEVKSPKLIQQTRGLDFGSGFYVTTKEEQAKSFSESLIKRRKTGSPIVSVFEYNEQAAQDTLDILFFPEPNAEWLEFIRDNRLNTYTGKQYDLIIGPVANDRVFPTIQALIIGQFTIEAALTAIKPYKLFDQYCFCTDKALSMLQFVKSITIYEGVK